MSYLHQLLRRLTDTSGGGRHLPPVTRWLMARMSGFNADKYWRRRAIVVDPQAKASPLRKAYYLWWIKRVDSRKCCSFGTAYNAGFYAVTPPILPHGPGGIVVGRDVRLGRGVIIYHQVTIAAGGVEIGDHVELGAGAKVLPHVKIGHHARVGANCVVVEDVPPYATVVLPKPRIIQHEPKNQTI